MIAPFLTLQGKGPAEDNLSLKLVGMMLNFYWIVLYYLRCYARPLPYITKRRAIETIDFFPFKILKPEQV